MNTHTIIIGSTCLTFNEAFHKRYENELRNGNTGVMSVPDSDPQYVERWSHSETKNGIARHYGSLEVIRKDENGVDDDTAKIAVTCTFPANDAEMKASASQIYDAWLIQMADPDVKSAFLNNVKYGPQAAYHVDE